jgi:hypothetical protein
MKVDDNTNVGLVTATVTDKTLTLSFAADDEGTAEITIEGSVAGQTISYTFQVGVGEVDIITVKHPDFIIISSNPDQETTIPWSDLFEVAGKPDAEVTLEIITLSDFTLIDAFIDENALVLSSIAGQLGSVDVTLSGTFGNTTKEFILSVRVEDTVQRISSPLKICNHTRIPQMIM